MLNQILRQSTTHLADGPFAVLVDYIRVLDFDVKRKYVPWMLGVDGNSPNGISPSQKGAEVLPGTVFPGKEVSLDGSPWKSVGQERIDSPVSQSFYLNTWLFHSSLHYSSEKWKPLFNHMISKVLFHPLG